MSLVGNLEDLSLPDILQIVSLSKKSGILLLEREGQQGKILIRQGRVIQTVSPRPGRTLGEIFARAAAAYAETGFDGEWQLHHQGGPAGYEPREFLATPDSADVVALGQAYAWNPSIAGTKSEDTILVGAQGNEEITGIRDWPMQSISLANGQVYARPAVLEVT